MPRVALILSSGRTGTQFLAHYFDANYDDVIARHEPRPSRSLRMASHAHMVGALSRETLVYLLRRKRTRHIDPLRASLYVESNPFLAGYAELIREVWDDATLIHIVRDPRDQVRSSLSHGTASGWKGLSNRFIPYWYPDVTRILQLPQRPGRIGMAAGVWTLMNKRLIDASVHYPRYRAFHYERVFDAGYTGLQEICELLELPFRRANAAVPPEQRMNAGRLAVVGDWREWPPGDCLELDRICQPLMRDYGYGLESEWQQKLAAAQS